MPVTRSISAKQRIQASHAAGQIYSTPEKARFRQAVAEFEYNGPTLAVPCKQSIFDRFEIPRRSANRILNAECDRTASNQEDYTKRRGRPAKVSLEQLAKYERIVTSFGFQGRSLL